MNELIELNTLMVGAFKAIAGRQSPYQPSIAEPLQKGYAEIKSGRTELFEIKTAITSTQAVNDPLTPSLTPAIDLGTRRTLRIRDLLPTYPTQNAAIEMPVKTGSTNNAGSQNGDNTSLGESSYDFTTSFTPIETIGHFIPASAQIMEDAGTLDAFVNTELLHDLQTEIDDQILNGDGTGHQLTGLIDNATAFTQTSPVTTNELDILRLALKQMEVADFNPTAIILNPNDWFDIEIRKRGSSDDSYAAGDPRLMPGKSLWSVPVVTTNSIASGTFLIGDFNRAAVLFDREQAAVQIARHDSDNFQKNMLTLRAMERLALVITNSAALITGSL